MIVDNPGWANFNLPDNVITTVVEGKIQKHSACYELPIQLQRPCAKIFGEASVSPKNNPRRDNTGNTALVANCQFNCNVHALRSLAKPKSPKGQHWKHSACCELPIQLQLPCAVFHLSVHRINSERDY